MNKSAPLTAAVLVAALLATLGGAARAQTYAFTDLGSLGNFYSFGFAINPQGRVAGFSGVNNGWSPTLWRRNRPVDLGPDGYNCQALGLSRREVAVGHCTPVGGGEQRAVRWSAGVVTELATTESRAQGINDHDAVVGASYLPTLAATHAMLWIGDQATDLGTLPGGNYSAAYDINAAGKVVGESMNSQGDMRATLWHGTRARDLGTLGGRDSWATAINNAGLVVGHARTVRYRVRAALWDGGKVIDLGSLAGDQSYALDINNAGTIVGKSYVPGHPHDRNSRAVIWIDRKIIDLNTLLDDATRATWVLRSANGINDAGQITGDAKNTVTGRTHAYRLTPPASRP
ncbi:DUF3466 family protein [Ideonella sp. YS5]|uniref:DUF3466 family protein n=1 Tax=Ideonella sp. YS5 TaxID=3453714 RepID=UPI003EEBDD79